VGEPDKVDARASWIPSVVCRVDTRYIHAMSKAEILSQLPTLPLSERREILESLLALEDRELTAAHQAWIDEAVASGPATPATADDWKAALERGLAGGKTIS
jgi:hypothetical protein